MPDSSSASPAAFNNNQDPIIMNKDNNIAMIKICI
jgi:hypothetical protein